MSFSFFMFVGFADILRHLPYAQKYFIFTVNYRWTTTLLTLRNLTNFLWMVWLKYSWDFWWEILIDIYNNLKHYFNYCCLNFQKVWFRTRINQQNLRDAKLKILTPKIYPPEHFLQRYFSLPRFLQAEQICSEIRQTSFWQNKKNKETNLWNINCSNNKKRFQNVVINSSIGPCIPTEHSMCMH